MTSKFTFRPLTALGLLAAVVFVVLGVVYFTKTANGLPSYLPGHPAGSAHHHVKHGVAMIGLAVFALFVAWFSTGSGFSSTSSSE